MMKAGKAQPRLRGRRWYLLIYPEVGHGENASGVSWRQPVVDVMLIAGAVAFGLLMLYPTAGAHSRLALVLDVILGALACAALVVRRSRPTHVGAFAVAASAVSAVAAGASLVALFTAAIRVRLTVLVLLTMGELVATSCFPLLYPGAQGFSYLTQVAIGSLLNLGVVGWGLMVRAQRNYLQSVEERAHDLQVRQEILAINARDQERRRIAREMHDSLAHRLSLLSVHAGALTFRPDLSAEQTHAMAAIIRDTSHHALEDLQEVIGLLRDGASPESDRLAPQYGLADLQILVEESRRAGVDVELDQSIDNTQTSSRDVAAAAAIYRIVQEGLTNARKHAPASPVRIVVQFEAPGEIMVTVSNFVDTNPCPESAIPGTGTGLRGLSERASLLGGTVKTATVNNQFVITGRLPWSA